ncbi:MAG: aminoacyl-tRNA hydrolase [Lysobacteraceae bacterium]
MSAIRLIVGLGNPGSEYEATRHNVGFRFVDRVAELAGSRFAADAKLQSLSIQVTLASHRLLLLKPATFMNRSGTAVAAALRYWKISAQELLVCHDDLDLSPGVARLKFDGGHGGQNGLRDIMAHLGNGAFHRLRIGIGHPGQRELVTPWVLGRAARHDQTLIEKGMDKALAVLPLLLDGQANEAMKRLHTKD